MKIKCIAVDDEPLALEKIKNYISKVSFLELIQTFRNGIDSIEFLRNNKIDLMFLDIQMEELTGIQLMEIINDKPKVIFTTAYDSYAIKSYELDVSDYLLKPISFDRFLHSVNKIYDIKLKEKSDTKKNHIETIHPSKVVQEDFIFVKTEYRMQKVNFIDILYIEGMKDYLRIICKTEKIMTLQNFQGMLDMLPSDNFIRIHKSYIIAVNKINHIDKGHVIIEKERIPIGESYKQLFIEHLKTRKLI